MDIGRQHLDYCSRKLTGEYFPRMLTCLGELSDEDLRWRPNEASNSVGNILLHLSGNLNQWIVSGLGGAADKRNRPAEFSERGPVARELLIERISEAVRRSGEVLKNFDPARLTEKRKIQVYEVTCLEAASHVVEHFSHHLGQVIYITKLRKAKDLKFYNL